MHAQPKPSVNQVSSPVPGPGEYNVNQSSAALARNIARTAFVSKSTRGFEPRSDVPAPGQYNSPIQLGVSQSRANSSPQPVFKSGVKRLADTTGPAAATPGPGAYNAADAERALRYDWIARAHSSAAFQASAADRFGRMPGKFATDGELGVSLRLSVEFISRLGLALLGIDALLLDRTWLVRAARYGRQSHSGWSASSIERVQIQDGARCRSRRHVDRSAGTGLLRPVESRPAVPPAQRQQKVAVASIRRVKIHFNLTHSSLHCVALAST